ncbi:MAG: hypothetical protein JNL01_02905 [Bdellovibrionales bacterium]|nr:hypothetical protein [Bdellovibrionales bacterium]
MRSIFSKRLVLFFTFVFSVLSIASPCVHAETDEEILQVGEISDGSYFAGGAMGTLVGLGIGHAIQGRFKTKGFIFLIGELGGTALLFSGTMRCLFQDSSCMDNSLPVQLGSLALVGFRLWEVIDVWITPPGMNARYKELKTKETMKTSFGLIPSYSTAARKVDGIGLGVTFRF